MPGPATPVDDVVVTGQRRRNGSSDPFPSLPSPPLAPPGEHNVKEPIEQGEFNPCDQPATRHEWDVDAAAAEAKEKMDQKRAAEGDADYNTREYGAWLYRLPDGRIVSGPVHVGNEFSNGGVGNVAMPLGDIDPTTIVGSVHSHSVGNHLPSPTGPDGLGDIAHLNWINTYGGGPGARLYIVAQTTVNAGQAQYDRINVYTEGTAQAAIDNLVVGPEVNPNGQSCPI